MQTQKTALLIIGMNSAMYFKEYSPYDYATVVSNIQAIYQFHTNNSELIYQINYDIDALKNQNYYSPINDDKLELPFLNYSYHKLKIFNTNNIIDIIDDSLITELKNNGIKNVILCGIPTCLFVLAAANKLDSHGFEIIIIDDACTDNKENLHQLCLYQLAHKMYRIIETKTYLNK